MKKIYLFAALAAMLAACSENDLTVEKQSPQAQQNGEKAMVFDAYVNRGTTRAGSNGILTTNGSGTHDIKLTEKGFGVFGYYTDCEPYSGITKPNFFYNEQVKWEGGTYPSTGSWTYSPIKYWPNEFGEDAISDQVDRVSLFAYAPWVPVDGLTGLVSNDGSTNYASTNITGMSRNTATGDPFIKYSSSMNPANAVDLCYGVAAENFTSSNSTYNPNDIDAGEPYIDVKKPGLDGKIKFDFKHATSQLVVTIDAVVNGTVASTAVDAGTRIWVRSVTFEGFTQKGALNLNDHEWYDVNGNQKITSGTITVFDGRKDGKEALYAATNENPSTLNESIIQPEGEYVTDGDVTITTPASTAGVTATKKNLFGTGTTAVTAPVFVIPTNEPLKVTIVYDVETYDKNLAYFLSDGKTKGSTIENTITKTIGVITNTEAGKKYTLNLHLGMRTVDFEASVSEWTPYIGNVDLPANVPLFTAGVNATITVPSNAQTYQFAIQGWSGGETVSFTKNGNIVSADPASVSADSYGVSIGSASISENTSVLDKPSASNSIVATGGTSSSTITISIKQLAHELKLSGSTTNNSPTITLGAAPGVTDAWANVTPNTTPADSDIKVKRNGQELTYDNSGTPAANTFNYNSTTGEITLKENTIAGQVYTITVKAGDAAPETISVVVPD